MSTVPKTPSERVPYSAIVDRPPLKLPGGARMVVWTIVNLEVWDIARAMARHIQSGVKYWSRALPDAVEAS